MRTQGLLKALGVAVCATLLAGLVVSSSPAAEPIKIGVVLSLTGRGGFLGTAEIKAIKAGVHMVNREGGIYGRPLEVFFEDDQSSPTTATVAATKLIREKNVCLLIGPSLVDSCMAVVPICEREGVPMLPMAPLTIPLKKWVFLVPLDDYYLSEKMVKFATTALGVKKIASLHDNTTYGRKGADGVRAHAPKHGLTIVVEEEFGPTDTNMIPQLSKIKAANPEAIILFCTAGAAAVVAKNYQQLGMERIPVITGGGVPNKEFPRLAGKVVEDGRWIPFACTDIYAEQLPKEHPFRRKLYDPVFNAIKELYGKDTEWDGFFRNGYDNIAIAVEALKIARSDDRSAIRDALERVKYEGFLGNFAYSPTDHQGTTGETFGPVMIKDGKYWPYEKK